MPDTCAWRPGLENTKRLVVKIGSSGLTHPNGGLDTVAMEQLTNQIADLRESGVEVVLVSSGAIQAGRSFLAGPEGEESIDYLMACSAVGQPKLLEAYAKLFGKRDAKISQVLLTHDDFQNRVRHINASSTLNYLLANNVLPILNENDSVSYREIAIGDNDQLAAMTAAMIEADGLVILTGTDGIYDRDPAHPEATHIPEVTDDRALRRMKFGSKSAVGRGGMKAKLNAVRKIMPLGITTVIASYKKTNCLLRAIQDNAAGTIVRDASINQAKGRSLWLLTTARFDRSITIDKGAYNALRKSSSLLPSGILKARGDFRRGDCVALIYDGEPFAVGLSEYDSDAINKIAGKKTEAIEEILGPQHTNNIIFQRNIVFRR